MLYSTYTKALMLTEDFQSMEVVNKRDLMVIQQFDYTCNRDRTNTGTPYGATKSSVLEVTIRIESIKLLKFFYEQIQIREAHNYSFLFEVGFDQQGNIESYDQATIVEGYVVDIKENYHTGTDRENKQMTATIRLLLSSIKYTNNHTSVSQNISS